MSHPPCGLCHFERILALGWSNQRPQGNCPYLYGLRLGDLSLPGLPQGFPRILTEPGTPWWSPRELHLAALQEVVVKMGGIPGQPFLRHPAKSFACILTSSSQQPHALGNTGLILYEEMEGHRS